MMWFGAGPLLILALGLLADANPSLPDACKEGQCRLTNRGWWPNACVHNLPSDTHVRSSDEGAAEIVYPNGSLQTLAPCTESIPISSHQVGSWRSAANLTGSHARPVTWWGNKLSSPIKSFTTEYYIPAVPKTGPGLSWWIGMEDDPVTVVIQPVVWTDRTGGWKMVSEICCPGGHDFRVGDKAIKSKDRIYGSITRGSGTHYTISIHDGSGTKHTLSHDMGKHMVLPLIEAEMYESDYKCTDMPKGSLKAEKLKSSPSIKWKGATGTLMSKCKWAAPHISGGTASASPPSTASRRRRSDPRRRASHPRRRGSHPRRRRSHSHRRRSTASPPEIVV